jgi:hypothetical protein
VFEAQETSPQQLAALVAAGKEEAKAALANADATWGAYLAAQRTQIAAASAEAGALPKSLEVLRRSAASGDAALARRKRIFIRNLKDIVKRNGPATSSFLASTTSPTSPPRSSGTPTSPPSGTKARPRGRGLATCQA